MTFLIAVFSNIFLAASFYFYRRMRGLKNYHLDIWTSLLLIALIQTIVGINVFLFTDYEIPWGLHSTLTDGIIERVYLEYYLSWCFLFLILGLGASIIRTSDVQEVTLYWSSARNTSLFDFCIVFIFLLIIFYDLYLIGDLPFYYIMNGDILGAEEAKGKFFIARMSSSIPLFGYLMQYFPLFALGWTFDRYLSDRKFKGLLIVIIFSIIYSGLTLIKSYALMPVIVCLVLYLSKGGYSLNLRFLSKVTLVCFSVVFLPFLLLADEVGWPVVLAILERVFLVQIQGAFLIRSHYDGFQLEALLEGAPLVARLGFETLDPAAEVLRDLLGDVAGLVNINSHFVGQGFVMFGPFISIIGPLFLFLNFALLTLISRIFSRSPFKRVSNVMLITVAALVPINNNFGNTVYLKSVLATIILLLIIWPIYSLTVGKNNQEFNKLMT